MSLLGEEMKIKDNYNTEKTEQRLVKYWKDEAKNGNKRALKILLQLNNFNFKITSFTIK